MKRTVVTAVLLVCIVVGICSCKKVDMTTKELKQYLGSTRSDILKTVGKGSHATGTMAIMESHMTFPTIWVKNLGLTFVFSNETDDLLFIVVSQESNVRNVNIRGARPGMTFNDITDLLGDSPVSETWCWRSRCLSVKRPNCMALTECSE